jgi:NADPH-dependent 2,4-dienoyl-CoA reductase/sulfur reductase-like enzyme
MMSEALDLIVVGGGPAGLAAAITARAHGLSCILIEENQMPGGQMYRGVEVVAAERPDDWPLFGPAYRHGNTLIEEARRCGAGLQFGALVWDATPDGLVTVRHSGKSQRFVGRRVLLATGAQERPVPVANWTLPGVMSVGAAQSALKSSGAIPSGRVIIAGCGPLLSVATQQLRHAGAQIVAVLTTTSTVDWLRASQHWPGLARQLHRSGKAVAWFGSRQGSAHISAMSALEIRGSEQVESVAFRRRRGQERALATDIVLLHTGLIPDVTVSRALGCTHQWDKVQLCWRPLLDQWGRSSHPKIFIAGDCASITGATAAEIGATLAALAIAADLGRLPASQRDELAGPLRARLRQETVTRLFLDTLFRPPDWLTTPERDTIIVCRCEEITVAEIRWAVGLGATGANQVKAFTRCGMGPCQGRMCEATVSALVAQMLRVDPRTVAPFRRRPPFKPVTLGEIASLEDIGDINKNDAADQPSRPAARSVPTA